MNKRIFLIVIIIILLVVNLSIENFQKKLYNTYSNRNKTVNSSDQVSQFNNTYNIEDESIKYVYRFLNNWQNHLTLDYLDENVYNTYSGDKKYILENYMKNLEVIDKVNNEIVLVKSGVSIDSVTKRQYVKLTLYVTEKLYGFTSSYATEIMDNSPDANKIATIVVYSDTPYNFKITLFLGDNGQNGGGRSTYSEIN